VFWAIANLLGLCAALKRGAERATLAVIHFNRSRRRTACTMGRRFRSGNGGN
jgi:hypothetical protein